MRALFQVGFYVPLPPQFRFIMLLWLISVSKISTSFDSFWLFQKKKQRYSRLGPSLSLFSLLVTMAASCEVMIRKKPRLSCLPEEILELILVHLPLEDHFHFGLVSKFFWSVMIQARRLLPPMPLLILKPGSHLDRFNCDNNPRFYAICGDEKYRKLSLNLNSWGSSDPVWCCGSSMGWLFMVAVNGESRIHFLNPISKERVDLPPFPPSLFCPGWRVSLSSAPTSDDCIVAVQICRILTARNRRLEILSTGLLAISHLKEKKWDILPDSLMDMDNAPQSSMNSFTFYEDRLYAIDIDGNMGIYDFDPKLRKIASVYCEDEAVHYNIKHLVVVDGKLLLSLTDDEEIRVYKLENNTWVRIQSLGDWVLLLNEHKAESFSTKQVRTSGFQANCVYWHIRGRNSLSVYSMEDCCARTLSLPVPQRWSRAEIDWFLARSWWLQCEGLCVCSSLCSSV